MEGLLAGLALAEPRQAPGADSPAPAAEAHAPAEDSAAGTVETAELPVAAAADTGPGLEQQMARLALAQPMAAPGQDANAQCGAPPAAQAQCAQHECPDTAREAAAGAIQAEQQPLKPHRRSGAAVRASEAAAAASAGAAKPKRAAGARRSSQASSEDADRENRDSSNVRTDAQEGERKAAGKAPAATHEAEVQRGEPSLAWRPCANSGRRLRRRGSAPGPAGRLCRMRTGTAARLLGGLCRTGATMTDHLIRGVVHDEQTSIAECSCNTIVKSHPCSRLCLHHQGQSSEDCKLIQHRGNSDGNQHRVCTAGQHMWPAGRGSFVSSTRLLKSEHPIDQDAPRCKT